MLDFGGTGSVLVVWSLLVVLIGAGLFIYGIGVSVRDRRGRRDRSRRRSSASAGRRSTAPARPQPSALPPRRPLALPAGPSAGGRGYGPSSSFGSQPLALPAGPSAGYPASQHHQTPAYQAQSYQAPTYQAQSYPAQSPSHQASPYQAPSHQVPSHQGPSHQVPSHQAPLYPTPSYQTPPYQAPAQPSPPSGPPPSWPPPATPPSATPPSAAPPLTQPTIMAPIGSPPAWTAPTSIAGPNSSTAYGSHGGGAPAVLEAGPGVAEVVSAPPAGYGSAGGTPDLRPTRKPRRDDCAELRAECVRLREQADGTIAAAAQAVKEAEEAHARYLETQQATEDANQVYQAAVAASAAVAADLQRLERVTTDDQRRVEQETTHAAFAAYRRGDISSDQLREVFRRAEGWTPEQDQLSRDVLTRRAEEGEAMRAREAAMTAEQAAGEHARITAISARALDEEASAAVDEARRLCARAAECGKRRR